MAKKVYAIQYGFDFENNKKIENLIVNTWDECLTYVKGVKGAKYKSFQNLQDAQQYLNEGQRMLKKSDDNYPKDCLHVYVDGSYNSASNKYSYGLVAVYNNVIEYIDGGSRKNDEKSNIRQIAGELQAAIKGVEYAILKKYNKVVIFHDYEGIAHHATGAWQRKDESSQKYYDKMKELMNSGINVIFVKVDSHTGDLFNELADEICKKELGISSDKIVQKHLKINQIFVKSLQIKEQLAEFAKEYFDNIIVENENSKEQSELLKKSKVLLAEDDNLKYKEIKNIYMADKEQGKKLISKLLSKEKEAFIIYLLEEE